MSLDPPVLPVSRLERVAGGEMRDVFDRPDHPHQRVKAIKPSKLRAYASRRGPLAAFKRRFTLGRHKVLAREYDCYLRAAWRADRLGREIPIAEFGGLVRTETGLGQVMNRVAGEDGALAPTLRDLFEAGRVTDALLADLSAFARDLLALNVIAPDLAAKNIVHGSEAGGPPRFLLIDGFGDSSPIPLRRWIPALNRRQLHARLDEIAAKHDVTWSRTELRFCQPRAPQ